MTNTFPNVEIHVNEHRYIMISCELYINEHGVSHFPFLNLKMRTTRAMKMTARRTQPTIPMMIPITVPAVVESPPGVWENRNETKTNNSR